MASPPRKAYVELPCRPGQLVMFESWLKHEVPANRGSEERISVSFNYDWV
jgi:uncharacterized protein (TIGR02466 family)